MDFLQVKLLCCLLWFCICRKSLPEAAVDCEPGHRKHYNSGKCIPCPEDQYQPTRNEKVYCMNCLTCDKDMGSEVISECTSTKDRQCQCREGFVPQMRGDESSCLCDKGSELDETGMRCIKCQRGYFNPTAGEKCKKWTDCGLRGMKTLGSHISDVDCFNDLRSNRTSDPQDVASATVISKKLIPMSTAVLRTSPQITTPSSSNSITPSTSASVPLSTTTPSVESSGFPGYAIVVPPVLLLIILSPVICRQIIISFIRKYKKKADTPCRSPVEESGDSSCSSLVKSCQGQP